MMKLVVAFALLATTMAAITPVPTQIIKIIRSDSSIAPDGSSFEYAYETENGISAEESGSLVGSGEDAGIAAEGSYKYTAPDGTPISIRYRADQDGFHPVGDSIPVTPEIPAAIVRALAYNEAHPESETSKPSASKGFILTSYN